MPGGGPAVETALTTGGGPVIGGSDGGGPRRLAGCPGGRGPVGGGPFNQNLFIIPGASGLYGSGRYGSEI